MIGISVSNNIQPVSGPSIKGCMIKQKECRLQGLVKGKERHEVVIEFYQSAASFRDGDDPINVKSETKRIFIDVKVGTELTETRVHQELMHALAKRWTCAEEK